MNLAEKRARVLAINERLAQIKGQLEKTTDSSEVTRLSAETSDLTEERGRLTAQIQSETARSFEAGAQSQTPAVTEVLSKRDLLCVALGKSARKHSMTDVEKRALGVALTTTASTYVEATALADGVNNAGVFISTKVVLDLLKEEGKLSPILADTVFSAIPGLTSHKYRKSRTKANAKAEGAEGTENQMEWASLELTKGYLQVIIPVTDEVMALTDFGFGEYIVNQILADLNEDWAYDLIYGAGSNEHVKGITIGATTTGISSYVATKAMEAIIAGIKLCKGQYRRGAKVYVAQDVYDQIMFAVDDNGNFKFPVFNNASGISSIGPIRVEVDENLKDGDFIIGNVGKFFKANALIPIRLETDRVATKGITKYVASELCATAPFVGAFIYGSKAA